MENENDPGNIFGIVMLFVLVVTVLILAVS
jgi:hypothetical protein